MINNRQPEVSNIEISGHKTKYKSKESFSSEGQIKVTYINDLVKEYYLTAATINMFNSVTLETVLLKLSTMGIVSILI